MMESESKKDRCMRELPQMHGLTFEEVERNFGYSRHFIKDRLGEVPKEYVRVDRKSGTIRFLLEVAIWMEMLEMERKAEELRMQDENIQPAKSLTQQLNRRRRSGEADVLKDVGITEKRSHKPQPYVTREEKLSHDLEASDQKSRVRRWLGLE